MGSPFFSVIPNSGPPQWGLYNQSGAPELVASSVKAIEYAHDYRDSDYQQEQGAFATYNKVQTPYTAKITYAVGGPAEDRAAFLATAELVVASLDLVSVVTPEIQYANANPTRIAYRRTERQGVTLLLVDVWCEEVRVISSATLSNTQSVNGAATQQNGVTQPGSTLTSQLAAPPSVGPQTTITTSQAQTNSSYQFFNLALPSTQNLSQTSDYYQGPF